MQNELSQIVDKYNRESFSTRSQIGQIALTQNIDFKQAIVIMGETLSDMDKEIEQRDIKRKSSENKIGKTDSEVKEEMKRSDLNKTLSKEKNDRIMKRLNKTLNNYKYIKNNKQ